MLPATDLILARPDEDLLAEVRDILLTDDQIKALDRDSLAVEVNFGVVRLWGHVASEINLLQAVDLASAVPGVVSVVNDLIADGRLMVNIGGALSADSRTRVFTLPVDAYHGWVGLGGEVPDAAARDAAREVAVAIAGVRGIVALPALAGQPPEPPKQALQPHVGSDVYTDDGRVGRVQKVVIDPRNRLVTEVIVNAQFEIDVLLVHNVLVVPVEAIQTVSGGGIFITDSNRHLAVRTPYGEINYVSPPAGWQPPFPYKIESILWPVSPTT